MTTRISDLLRRTFRTDQILERLERIERSMHSDQTLERLERIEMRTNEALERLDRIERGHSDRGTLEILPGTPYSRYAIPVEYLPSRSFQPRWGYSQGRIEALAQWFAAHNDDYREFLGFMCELDLGHIPHSLSPTAPLAPAWVGGAITAFDCLALYAIVRKHSPKLYLEIGSGMTTCFARQAITDARLRTRVVSIDPQPRREVDDICDQVIREGLETCDLSLFDKLEEDDILFLDGSHRSFMNSDVTVFFIDILPRIKPGVIVHVHDILLPLDYPESFKTWYWNEQYMLAVYMMASKATLYPLLPTSWITTCSEFSAFFQNPFVDLGSDEANQTWKFGGSMWFKRTA
jgi:Methyltransferase domain